MTMKPTRPLVAGAVVVLFLCLAALPASAWTYRYLYYPGWGLSASTGLFSEGSCGATGSTQGVAYYPTQTVKSTGGSGCRVSAQIGIWNGGGVTWEREDVDPTLVAVGSIYQPYMTRHGVD